MEFNLEGQGRLNLDQRMLEKDSLLFKGLPQYERERLILIDFREGFKQEIGKYNLPIEAVHVLYIYIEDYLKSYVDRCYIPMIASGVSGGDAYIYVKRLKVVLEEYIKQNRDKYYTIPILEAINNINISEDLVYVGKIYKQYKQYMKMVNIKAYSEDVLTFYKKYIDGNETKECSEQFK